MKRWALVEGTLVKNVVEQETQPQIEGEWVWIEDGKAGPGWFYVDGQFINPVPPPPPPGPTWVISKVAMISRFTSQEYVGIVGATKTDIEVQAWYDLFQAANRVDLKDQRTISGINALVPKNLITQERADTILTTPAQPGE